MHQRIVLIIGMIGLWANVFAQQPCLQGYTYRRAVSVSNSSTQAQSNQLVEIKFSASDLIANSKMLSNCIDIAFTDENGSLLSYWIDEANPKSNNQSVWVKLPNVPANGTSMDIFMFYGNPSAFSRSDANIFDGFDNFDNTPQWSTCSECSGTSIEVINGHLTVYSNTAFRSDTVINQNYAVDAYVSNISGQSGSTINIGQFNPNFNANGYALSYRFDNSGNAFELNSINGMCPNITPNVIKGTNALPEGVWSFSWDNTNNEIFGMAPGNNMNSTVPSLPSISAHTFISVDGQGSVTIDWIRYRRIADFEISSTLSATEEMINATTELALSTNAPFCAGSDDLIISASFISGATYTWKEDGIVINGQNTHTLTLVNASVTNSGVYSANVSIGTPECNSKTSQIEVIIDEPIVPGNISADVDVCETSNQGAIRLTNYAGTISGWQYRVNHSGLWYDLSTSIDSLEFSNLSETHSFRARFESGTCGTGLSDSSTVTVSPSTNTGVISPDETICTGTTGNVSLSGYTGNILDWEKSSDKINFISINHQNNTYQYTLTDSAYYRAIVKSGVCALQYSDTVLIAVSPATVPGAVEDGQYVCAGSNKDTLFLRGATGDVLRWEFGPTSNGPWSENSSHADYFIYQGLSNTMYYRALVESPGCAQAHSEIDSVVVEQLPNAGNLLGSAEVCGTANSGNLQLTSYNDQIIDWLLSQDGNSWLPLGYTNETLSYSNLNQNSYYRTVVNTEHKVCIPDTSNIATVSVSPTTVPGTLFSNQTVLCEISNRDTIVVSGETGNIQYWESSPTGEAPWSTIAISNDRLVFENQKTPIWYRAAVQSGACELVRTTPIQIEINSESEGGTVLGGSEVCELVNTGELDLLNHKGTIALWEYSTDNQNWATYPNNSSTKLEFDSLLATTYFRAIVKSGLCPYDTSNTGKITVNPLPDVAYAVENVNFGDPAVFQNNTTIQSGNVQNWLWDFGDNESSASKNPSHRYSNQGNYHARLTAFSNKGCVDSASKTVSVYGLPDVNFTFENVCLFSEMNFTNTSTIIGGTTYIWNFGDGSPVTSAINTSHNYAEPGNYKVTLKAISSLGGVDSIVKTVSVFQRSSPNFEVENICEGTTAAFANHTTPTAISITYFWDFGNGQTDVRTDPSVEYANSGSYLVKMKATTSNGCIDSISKIVEVYPQPVADFSVENVPYRQASVFVNESSIMPYSKLSYHWEFGDGKASDTINPVYIYEAPAVYPVVLTATSEYGCSNSIGKQTTIFALPVAKFSFKNVCDGDSMVYINESTIPSGNLTFEWEFGDGNSSIKEAPSHLYQNPGSYTTRLICISNNGARDTVFNTVQVFDLPVAEFNFNEACDGYTTNFENISSVNNGQLVSILWDFGDGTNSVQKNPTKDYLNSAEYNVELEVISSNGCAQSVTKKVIVHPNPISDFSVSDVCFGGTTEFINSSSIDNTLRPYDLFYTWEFGDGSGSVLNEPSYKYQNPEVYRAQLVVNSNVNCYDTLVRYVEVFSLPEANAGEDTTATKGFPILLNASGGVFYEWSPETGLSDISIPDPEARPMETTDYTVRVTDENKCVNYDTLTVFVKDEMRILPSNILTPNNNGENDAWNIVNIDSYPEAEIQIFDRWGKLVYKTTDYRDDWIGINLNGDILPDGTYYYIIVLNRELNIIYKGAITILRDK